MIVDILPFAFTVATPVALNAEASEGGPILIVGAVV